MARRLITEQEVEEALEAAWLTGYEQGKQHKTWPVVDTPSQEQKSKQEFYAAQIKLVNAVGQALNVNSTLLEGLAHSLDNQRVP